MHPGQSICSAPGSTKSLIMTTMIVIKLIILLLMLMMMTIMMIKESQPCCEDQRAPQDDPKPQTLYPESPEIRFFIIDKHKKSCS